MKTIKWMSKKKIAFVIVILLAVGVGVASTGVGYSMDTAVDTRTLSRVVAEEDKPLDSRSYTIDWSVASALNTKRIISTLILIR